MRRGANWLIEPTSDVSQPFFWWGPAGSSHNVQSLHHLVEKQMLSAELAGELAARVRTGRSMTIAAAPSKAGKTTLLTALCGAIPADRQRVYLRGVYERFDFVSRSNPDQTVLLVNEISGHLPIYSWGDPLHATLRLAAEGYQLLATTHASTPEDLVFQLSTRPIAASAAEIASLGTIVFVEAREVGRQVERRVARVVELCVHASTNAVEVVEVWSGGGGERTIASGKTGR